ncbi:MAG: hypothetical protein AAF604_11740 [Acidobacteriota bacterium]
MAAVPSAVREGVVVLLPSAEDQGALRWLGRVLYERAVESPASPAVLASVQPSLSAAAVDLWAVAGSLQSLGPPPPEAAAREALLVALAHRHAAVLALMARSLERAASDSPACQ